MKLKILASFVCLTLALSATARADEWGTDYNKALEQAKKEKKIVVLDFTGSDWCGWCIKLKNEVFSKQEFKDFAAKNLVLVEVDFPRNKPQSAELKKQNQQLQGKFGIKGYPTIIVLDSNGNPLGGLGYSAGGPSAWLAKLKQIMQKAPTS